MSASERTEDLRVFISYSHDSLEHSERVRALADQLRRHGINVELDRYQTRPPKGWPYWCEEQLREANSHFVLVICTETYRKRVEDKVPADEGRGVFWEGSLIRDYIYDSKGNERFIPILLEGAKEDDILLPLKNHQCYRLSKFDFTDIDGYKALYRELTGQPAVIKREIGTRVELDRPQTLPAVAPREVVTSFPTPKFDTSLPHVPPHLVGREAEMKQLDDYWSDPDVRVATIVAWAGVGKSALVGKWADRLRTRLDQGQMRYREWSFHSQGAQRTDDATVLAKIVSADLFIAWALQGFGEKDTQRGSPIERGLRLAEAAAALPTLLILDGLEPLQEPFGVNAGKLKDEALSAFLRSFADRGRGLCVVTSRLQVKDLERWRDSSVPELRLDSLSEETGAELLITLGVKKGTNEAREKLSREVRGHALALTLMGKYLAKFHRGDIGRANLVKFEKADEKTQGGDVFQVLNAYEDWFRKNKGDRELAILRLLGLFDRPATPDCLFTLCKPPVIAGLTEPLMKLPEEEWNEVLQNLCDLQLVETSPWEPKQALGYKERTVRMVWDNQRPLGHPTLIRSSSGRKYLFSRESLSVHPLLREHFARRLRDDLPDKTIQEAHRRLYEHLKASVPYWPEGLEGLDPLYQAVAHGCRARIYRETCAEVFKARIRRGDKGEHTNYSRDKLAAFNADLAGLANFFDQPWDKPTPSLSEEDQAWLLNEAGYLLRSQGLLIDAYRPILWALEIYQQQGNWSEAASCANNLSGVALTRGEIPEAIEQAKNAVRFSDLAKNTHWQMATRARLAYTRHQKGDSKLASKGFQEAEHQWGVAHPECPILSKMQGFMYCELLLAKAEREAWRAWMQQDIGHCRLRRRQPKVDRILNMISNIRKRAEETLRWMEKREGTWLLDLALGHVTLARIALYDALCSDEAFALISDGETKPERMADAEREINDALDRLQKASYTDHLPFGRLTRAWLRTVQGKRSDAVRDLRKAEETAEREPMKLHLADIALCRARLFRDRGALKQARQLINECGYHRRDAELQDAEDAAKDWQ